MKRIQADARHTGLPRASFDVVHARLVLVDVPEPQALVEEMVGLCRPGGTVASHEADWGMSVCHPPSAAWDRLLEVFERYSRNHGIDLFVLRKTHQMFRAAALTDIHVQAVIRMPAPGNEQRTILCDFLENVKGRMLTEGLIAESEFNQGLADLRRHLDDAETLVISPLYVQLWGSKPKAKSASARSA